MREINWKRAWLTVAFGLGGCIVSVVGLFAWAIATDKAPQFFPLQNQQARYTIVKSTSLVQGTVESGLTNESDPEAKYFVEYRGDGIVGVTEESTFFRVLVGDSQVELEPFVGKDVSLTRGEFVSSSQQCIVGRCVDIYGPWVVLDIDGLELRT